jgi:outer membrane protein assembly factor BamB
MRRLLVLLVLCCLAAALRAADWPRFLGPAANGISAETGLNVAWAKKVPTPLWQVALGDNGYAGPAVAYGKLFIVDHQGRRDVIRAFNLENGAELWHYAYDNAVNENGGSFGYTNSTPYIEHGRIYTVSNTGIVTSLDTKDGKLIWSRNLVNDFGGRVPGWRFAWSPIIDDGKLIVYPGGRNAGVAALNPLNGQTIWAGGGSDVPGYATPVVATLNGKKQYLVFTTAGLMGVDPADGSRLWSYPWKTSADVNAACPIAVDNNSVFITTAYGHGSALIDVAPGGTARARWETNALQSRFSTPIFTGGYLYTTTDNNNLVCIEPQTGAVKWRQPGFEWGGLCMVSGAIIVCDGRTGDVVSFTPSPDGYRELGRIKPLGERSWTAPIVADGKLIVRNLKRLGVLSLK